MTFDDSDIVYLMISRLVIDFVRSQLMDGTISDIPGDHWQDINLSLQVT